MGRKNHESIIKKYGAPLLGRESIIVSRTLRKHEVPSCTLFRSMDEVLGLIFKHQQRYDFFVIGGGEIYKSFLSFVNTMYVTHIERRKYSYSICLSSMQVI